MRTQVGIVGAGPAGLMLSHLLHRHGVESVIIETRSQQYCEGRVRAGVLEHTTVELLRAVGLDERMKREGLVHEGIELRFGGRRHRIDMAGLTGGRTITIYAQHELVKDLIQARLSAGGRIIFDAEQTKVSDFDTSTPKIIFHKNRTSQEVVCDFIAGCDGFQGVCRQSIPSRALTVYEKTYPFAWLGILAQATPSSQELVYAHHEQGFALLSMRSPELGRLYLQCDPHEDIRRWSDARIWQELHTRLGTGGSWTLNEGPVVHKSITGMRSFVVEPMQYERLFLAGDAAHIVPPTGAKGLNLAIADIRILARALVEFFTSGEKQLLDEYSATCLRRVWRVQRFSWWMTSLLHTFAGQTPFDQRRQIAELDYVTNSRAASQSLAENYVGLPMN
jgi:p-hydroxybenzoate 3-monooxygenase